MRLALSNREVWEEAAGYGLEPMFFGINHIDPDKPAEWVEDPELIKVWIEKNQKSKDSS